MQPKTLLAMFVVMLALGGFIFFYEKDLPSTDERKAMEKKVLGGLESDEVEGLVIAWGDEQVQLDREDTGSELEGDEEGEGTSSPATWHLSAPLEARADRTQVESLLTSLTGLQHQRRLDEVDRADAGLEDPAVRVTLRTTEGEKVLRFGSEVPASSARIVALDGESGAFVVPGGVVDELRKVPGEWRDKKLFTASRPEIERVTLEQDGQRLILARRGEDFWLENPVSDLADDDRMQELMTAITGLTVADFVDSPGLDPSAMGLDPALTTLEVMVAGDEEPFRLDRGSSVEGGEGRLYGQFEGTLFEIDAGLDESLALTTAEWRARAWTPLQVFQVDGLSAVDGEGTTEVRRDGADWRRGEDKIDYTIASDFLYAVADAKAEQVLERSQAAETFGALGEPDLTVTLSTEDEEDVLHLHDRGEVALVTREGREAVLRLSAEIRDDVLAKLKAVRQAEVQAEEVDEEEPEES